MNACKYPPNISFNPIEFELQITSVVSELSWTTVVPMTHFSQMLHLISFDLRCKSNKCFQYEIPNRTEMD